MVNKTSHTSLLSRAKIAWCNIADIIRANWLNIVVTGVTAVITSLFWWWKPLRDSSMLALGLAPLILVILYEVHSRWVRPWRNYRINKYLLDQERRLEALKAELDAREAALQGRPETLTSL